MTTVWDDPELRASGEFVKLEAVGDSVAGTVSAIRKHRWEDGSVCPQVFLVTDDGEEKTLTAGQVRLKALLGEKRPEAGDHITIRLTDVEKRAGGKTLKHFSLDVKPGGGNGGAAPATTEPPASAPTTPAAVQPDPAAVAAALQNMTPEQRAALGFA